MIHPTAIIEDGADIGADVEIGPFSVIGKDVKIGRGTKVHGNVLITGWTTLGENNTIFQGAVIGEAPQDLGYKGERSYVEIGNNNQIREYVTIHRGAQAETKTVIGSDNLIMGCSHIAHNCQLGNSIVMANYVGLAGHVTVENEVVFGGFAGIHQHVRIGRTTMIAGYSKVIQDVPPFLLVEGMPVRVMGLNVHGLKKRGIHVESRKAIKKVVGILTNRKNKLVEIADTIKENVEILPEVEHFISFITSPSRMGLLRQAAVNKSGDE
jgi:UDP-N-acetylglucosamine acyltransferase